MKRLDDSGSISTLAAIPGRAWRNAAGPTGDEKFPFICGICSAAWRGRARDCYLYQEGSKRRDFSWASELALGICILASKEMNFLQQLLIAFNGDDVFGVA